nr:hypothetical protein RVX_1975 [Nitratidesulfovibrio sp. HK-II]
MKARGLRFRLGRPDFSTTARLTAGRGIGCGAGRHRGLPVRPG